MHVLGQHNFACRLRHLNKKEVSCSFFFLNLQVKSHAFGRVKSMV